MLEIIARKITVFIDHRQNHGSKRRIGLAYTFRKIPWGPQSPLKHSSFSSYSDKNK